VPISCEGADIQAVRQKRGGRNSNAAIVRVCDKNETRGRPRAAG